MLLVEPKTDRERERGKILIILGFNYSKTVIPMRLSSHYYKNGVLGAAPPQPPTIFRRRDTVRLRLYRIDTTMMAATMTIRNHKKRP